ncbi:hypothetical protein [Spirosoma areae]
MSYIAREIVDNPESPVNFLHIDWNTQQVTHTIHILSFMDNGYHINYAPALKLSSYGNSFDEAKDMMVDVVLPDFFQEMLNLAPVAVLEYLSKLGWSAIGRESKDFENKSYVDKDGILRNFSLPQDTIIEEEVLTVA